MSKIYDIAFRMGVLFNILLFTILNIVSYKIAEDEVARKQAEIISFAPCCRIKWGIPFDWDAKYFVIEGAGAIFNIIIIAFCAFAFGFLFKFVWSKISQRNAELK